MRDRSRPDLVGFVHRGRARRRARALCRRLDVFLRGRGAGRLGLPLAQHLRPVVGFPVLPVAGGNLCRADRRPAWRHRALRSAVLQRAALGADRAPGRPTARSAASFSAYACCSTALLCPLDLRLSDRDVAGACLVLAGACRQPWQANRHRRGRPGFRPVDRARAHPRGRRHSGLRDRGDACRARLAPPGVFARGGLPRRRARGLGRGQGAIPAGRLFRRHVQAGGAEFLRPSHLSCRCGAAAGRHARRLRPRLRPLAAGRAGAGARRRHSPRCRRAGRLFPRLRP